MLIALLLLSLPVHASEIFANLGYRCNSSKQMELTQFLSISINDSYTYVFGEFDATSTSKKFILKENGKVFLENAEKSIEVGTIVTTNPICDGSPLTPLNLSSGLSVEMSQSRKYYLCWLGFGIPEGWHWRGPFTRKVSFMAGGQQLRLKSQVTDKCGQSDLAVKWP